MNPVPIVPVVPKHVSKGSFDTGVRKYVPKHSLKRGVYGSLRYILSL
jgi:hypothetical protein